MGKESTPVRQLTAEDLNRLDSEFLELWEVVCRRAKGESIYPDLPIDGKADRMFDIAFQLGDRDMMKFCFAAFGLFVEQGVTPPPSMMGHISDAFGRFQTLNSLDDAFGLKTGRRGHPKRLMSRHRDAFTMQGYSILRSRLSKTEAILKLEEILDVTDLSYKFKGIK